MLLNQGRVPCNKQIHIKIPEDELPMIHDRMEQIGVKNMSAYIRKMAIDGYYIHIDFSELLEIIKLLKIDSNNIDNQGDWGTLPNKQNRIRCTPMHCLPICESAKTIVEGGAIAMKNKVIVKDRDEWSSLANFLGNMIAKYADEIDFDSLPDPDVYLQKRYIYESYKAYMKFRNKKAK